MEEPAACVQMFEISHVFANGDGGVEQDRVGRASRIVSFDDVERTMPTNLAPESAGAWRGI